MTTQSRPSSSVLEIIRSFVRNWQLIRQMTRREVVGRYRGSVLGLAWSFLNPLLMLAVYTLVFSVVFKARWNLGSDSKIEFALALFIGLIVHGMLAECLHRAPTLILENPNYVKRVVFPLEILPWVTMGSVLFHAAVSLLVWLVAFLLLHHALNWTAVLLPIVLMPLVLLAMGVSWLLASLGVFLRDVGQVSRMVATVLLFLSPVFYPTAILPETFRAALYLNPLTTFIEQSRDVLMWGTFPDATALAATYGAGLAVCWLGFAWFQRTRRGFADVI